MSSMVRVTVGNGPAHAAPISCVALRADGGRLASGSHDRSVFVWDTGDPSRPVKVTEFGHHAAVLSVAFNPAAADLLATGSADGTAAVWRVVDDRPPSQMKVLAGHPGPVTSVAWMPDGQHLICQISSSRAAVWNAFGETYLGELEDCVRLTVSPHGLVATVGSDGLVAVRDLWRDPGRITYLPGAAVEDCAWSPDGMILALAGDDGAIELLDPGLLPIRSVRLGDAPLRGITWSADGGALIAGTYDPALVALDTAGRPQWRRTEARLWPRSIAAAGSLVAAATFGGRPYLVDLATGGGVPETPVAEPSARFRAGVLAATGRILTAGNAGDRHPLWEHDTRVTAVAALADRVVVSAAHRAVRVMLVADGPDLAIERGITLHAPEPVKAVAVLGAVDAPVVVAASYDFRLYSWTLDWSGIPAGPRLIGEFGYGIAALTRLDDHRLTATDHHGELVILALGADGALSA
ncbi:WD40 repeat domain-containing protein [Actinoplanes sp. NPDC051513]|uniref:WD40 repeat domain-containing protein n=1 Tax=Actinoplanes sp. NPDC051513 TaxID=3363908 RepID=UPI0037962338